MQFFYFENNAMHNDSLLYAFLVQKNPTCTSQYKAWFLSFEVVFIIR